MKYLTSVLLFLLFINFTCNENSVSENEDNIEPIRSDLIIKSGDSFGMCVGYCIHEISINQTETKFTMKSRRDSLNYPEQTFNTQISAKQWNDLYNSIDLNEFKKLQDVYGCPDCADGGAEWIEIIDKDFTKKVYLEYGDSLAPVQNLLDQLRTLRKKFKDRFNEE